MLFEDVTANLYPRGDQVTTLTAVQAIDLRAELEDSFTKMLNIRSLLHKVGSKVNEKGYSI